MNVGRQRAPPIPARRLVSVFLPGMLLQPSSAADSIASADKEATSFGQAVQICLNMQRDSLPAGKTREG